MRLPPYKQRRAATPHTEHRPLSEVKGPLVQVEEDQGVQDRWSPHIMREQRWRAWCTMWKLPRHRCENRFGEHCSQSGHRSWYNIAVRCGFCKNAPGKWRVQLHAVVHPFKRFTLTCYAWIHGDKPQRHDLTNGFSTPCLEFPLLAIALIFHALPMDFPPSFVKQPQEVHRL